MARRPHRSKQHATRTPSPGARRGYPSASVLVGMFALAGAAIWFAGSSGWLPFGGQSSSPEVRLVPSRTSIPLPPGGTVPDEPAPTASGRSEASSSVFACIERLHVNNDVLQPLRRELDYQIWPNPEYQADKKSARYQFRLRKQLLRSHDAGRLIREVRACTALE